MKIDPVENKIVHSIRLHGWIGDLAAGGGLVWAPVVQDGQIYKLSEDDLSVQGLVAAGPDPERISIRRRPGLGCKCGGEDGLGHRRLHSGARARLPAGAEPTTVAYHDGLVWAGAAPKPPSLPPISGQELRISTPSPSYDPDPAHAGPSSEQYLYETCANLLNYPDSAGPDGARLRPEIAAAMPSVSKGGRIYTFRIRRGFRFSPPSNEPVTAETFRYTIERTLAPSQQHGWPFGSDIAGASAYSAGKAPHISGIAVHGNTLAITLVRPAGDFLTRISMFNFCPVPLAEPVQPTGPVPSAGPYYVASSSNDRTVLLRNPNYTGKRPRRSERIVYTSYIRTPQAVARIDRGTIDYLPGDFRQLLVAHAWRRTRPAVWADERRRPGRQAAVLPGADAARRRSRLQHQAPPVSRCSITPCRQLRPRPTRTSASVLRRSERPDHPAGCSRPPRPGASTRSTVLTSQPRGIWKEVAGDTPSCTRARPSHAGYADREVESCTNRNRSLDRRVRALPAGTRPAERPCRLASSRASTRARRS